MNKPDVKDPTQQDYEYLLEGIRIADEKYKALYEAAEAMAGDLEDCRKELWCEWKSYMSEGEFQNNPTIADINESLAQFNALKGKDDE